MIFLLLTNPNGCFLRKRFANKRKIIYWHNGFTKKGLAILFAGLLSLLEPVLKINSTQLDNYNHIMYMLDNCKANLHIVWASVEVKKLTTLRKNTHLHKSFLKNLKNVSQENVATRTTSTITTLIIPWPLVILTGVKTEVYTVTVSFRTQTHLLYIMYENISSLGLTTSLASVRRYLIVYVDIATIWPVSGGLNSTYLSGMIPTYWGVYSTPLLHSCQPPRWFCSTHSCNASFYLNLWTTRNTLYGCRQKWYSTY